MALKHFPGDVSLEETTRACTDAVINGKPKRLLRVEAVILNDNGTSQNLNEAEFETVNNPLDILEVFNDFLFVDVSTAQGASEAAAASNTRTNIGGPGAEFNIWVDNRLVPVQILGKHVG